MEFQEHITGCRKAPEVDGRGIFEGDVGTLPILIPKQKSVGKLYRAPTVFSVVLRITTAVVSTEQLFERLQKTR